VFRHPGGEDLRLPNGETRQLHIDLPPADVAQVVEKLVLSVLPAEVRIARVVGAADVSGVPAVSTAHVPGRALQNQHPPRGAARRQRGAEGGVAAADHDDIIGVLLSHCLHQSTPARLYI